MIYSLGHWSRNIFLWLFVGPQARAWGSVGLLWVQYQSMVITLHRVGLRHQRALHLIIDALGCSLGMDKQFYPKHYWTCDSLSILRLKLINVSKSSPWRSENSVNNTVKYILKTNSAQQGLMLHAGYSTSSFRHNTMYVSSKCRTTSSTSYFHGKWHLNHNVFVLFCFVLNKPKSCWTLFVQLSCYLITQPDLCNLVHVRITLHSAFVPVSSQDTY